MNSYAALRPWLFQLDPERAHAASLTALAFAPPVRLSPPEPELAQTVWGLPFANPVGMAAGYDKNAEVPDALLRAGFGFAEVGTLTPAPQAGNPKPRVFRLVEDGALINRLGFNNAGHQAALVRLQRRPRTGIVGVNIGANKESADRASDYVLGLRTFNGVASYFTVNISSPNTPGLRELQAPAALAELLGRLTAARLALVEAGAPHRPIVVKLAPDIADADLPAIVDVILAAGCEGIAISNTTVARHGLSQTSYRTEAGGLSGRPLFERSTRLLARVRLLVGDRLPLIGIGGVSSGATALAKIEAGATLIQLYTGLIYEGPALIKRIRQHLASTVRAEGLTSIAQLRGRRAEAWAARTLP
jgi:dihydroorotate dehydrogenase